MHYTFKQIRKSFSLWELPFNARVPTTIRLDKPVAPIGRLEKDSTFLDKPRSDLLMAGWAEQAGSGLTWPLDCDFSVENSTQDDPWKPYLQLIIFGSNSNLSKDILETKMNSNLFQVLVKFSLFREFQTQAVF